MVYFCSKDTGGAAEGADILKNQLFHFHSLIKKKSSLEAYLKSATFEDNGQGSPKNLFSILKIDRRRRHRRLKKTAIFCTYSC